MTRRQLAMTAFVILCLALMITWASMADRSQEPGTVRVVVGADEAPQMVPHPVPAPVATWSFPAVAPFDNLTRYERLMLAEGRHRDTIWAPQAEAALRAAIAPSLGGLLLETVRCAEGVCRLEGVASLNGRSQDDLVQLLMNGGIQRGFRLAGFIPNGNMVIDAEENRDLRFVQYINLPDLAGTSAATTPSARR